MNRFMPSLCLIMLANLSACRTIKPSVSEEKVTYGIKISESKFPSVVMLAMKVPEGTGTCTGTFVTDSLLVTAAHCMIGLDAKQPDLYYALPKGTAIEKKTRALSFAMHPKASKDAVNQWDLAVVSFPKGTAPATSRLVKKSLKAGDAITIIGYGNETFFPDPNTQDAGGGIKRYGNNEVQSVKDGLIMVFGVPGKLPEMKRGEFSATASGDSGGALLLGQDLAGVVSGGDVVTNDQGDSEAISEFVDLATPSNQEFLKSAGVP